MLGKPVLIPDGHMPAMSTDHQGKARRNVSGTAGVVSASLGRPSLVRGGNMKTEEVTVLLSVCLQDRLSRGSIMHPGLSTLRLLCAVFGQQTRAGESWSLLRGVQGPAGPFPSALPRLAMFPVEADKEGDSDQPLH